MNKYIIVSVMLFASFYAYSQDEDVNVWLEEGKTLCDKQEYGKALTLFQKVADQDNAEAQYMLGWMYDLGLGVEPNSEISKIWYRKAAENGNARAQYVQGTGCLENGDTITAFQWFEKSAIGGYVDSQYNMGLKYYNGVRCKKNYKKAFGWFLKAASQNPNDYSLIERLSGTIYESQFRVGTMYECGRGTKKNLKEAVSWYRKAAEKGNSNAQCFLAKMYEEGKGVNKSSKMAFQWYEKAAEAGDELGQAKVGMMYHYGDGVGVDEEKAFYWFDKAAEQGSALGQLYLSDMYLNGYGVERNLDRARYWKYKYETNSKRAK